MGADESIENRELIVDYAKDQLLNDIEIARLFFKNETFKNENEYRFVTSVS